MVGDLLSEIDDINIYCFDWMKQIAGKIKEGISVNFVVLRKIS